MTLEIILNEKKKAEEIIESGEIGEKPAATLNLLARYYRQIDGISGKTLFNKLDSFMTTYYRNYNPVKWTDTIEKQVKISQKYPLLEADSVQITRNEIDTIKGIGARRIERVLFTMLCLAKFYDIKNPKNNHWVNLDDKVIFSMAAAPMSKKDQNKIFHYLYVNGYIAFSRKVDNLNSQILFVDNESDIVAEISDFRKLGYEYLLLMGENYFRCKSCGILSKQNKAGSRQFCNNCVGYKPMKYKTIICQSCGQLVLVSAKNNKTCRCDECQAEEDRKKACVRQKKFRENNANKSQ